MASTHPTRLSLPLREGEGGDSAAVGDSAVSSTAPFLGELERLPPTPGGCCADESDRDPAESRVSPRFSFEG
jgi:hypothetical protein